MNKKLAGIILVLTLIPAGLLVWLGMAGIAAEKERAIAGAAALSRERLEVEKGKISAVFSAAARDLLSHRGTTGIDDARARTRRDPLVRGLFALDMKGNMVYPSENTPLGESERDFLARTKELGISPGLFLKSGDENPAAPASSGWYGFYLADGVNFIFWMKAHPEGGFVPGGIIGIELNRMYLLSTVLRALPDTPENDQGSFLAALVDVNGKVLYQWGTRKPAAGEGPIAVLPLDPPAASWTLKYFVDPRTLTPPGTSVFPIAASVVLLILAVVGIAAYLYRESTREIREAMEKVSFVNQVSHELKTPLTNIRMFAELLEGSACADDEKSKSYLSVIVSESGRLSRLIGNVLAFAKDRKHGIKFNPAPASPEERLRSAAANFIPSLTAKGIRIDLEILSTEKAVFDADILEQIVNNLVGNGEKYAASGGFIGVRLERRADYLVLTVSDLGPGIPPKLREKVFQPFFRISSRLTDGVTGAGIGLSIVRSLARLHGGEARILPSERGAVFEVTLRAPAADAKGEENA